MEGRLRAWSSLAGLAFSVLVVIGAMLLFDGPEGSSPAKMAAWYGSSSNRNHVNIGWILAGLAVFFFVWFVGAVRDQVASHETAGSGNRSLLSTVVTVGGAATAAVLLCLIGITDGVRTMSDDTYHHQVYSGVIHAAGDASYVMLASGGAALSAMIFAISAAILSFGFLPRWLGWFGVVAGVAALFSIIFFPMFIWLLWIAVTSVMLFLRARSPVPAERRTAAPAAG